VDLQPVPNETSGTALHSGRLTVLGIVFFVVAAAAPLVGVTGAVPLAVVLGNGAGVPGAYLAVGIVLLLFSVGYAAMSRRVTNTGAFFAYVGRGLGIGAGVGSAYVCLVAYLAIQLSIYGFFGAVAAARLDDEPGISLDWWVWALLAWALVLVLSASSMDVGARLLGALMLLEISTLLLTAIAVLVQGGGPGGLDLGASFSPDQVLAGGLRTRCSTSSPGSRPWPSWPSCSWRSGSVWPSSGTSAPAAAHRALEIRGGPGPGRAGPGAGGVPADVEVRPAGRHRQVRSGPQHACVEPEHPGLGPDSAALPRLRAGRRGRPGPAQR
jgi:hypothetical protein